jgi:hypothetical protein
MISSFRDDWLRAFFVDDVDSRNIPPDLASRLFRKLQMLDDATTDQDFWPSNHFEKLRVNRRDFTRSASTASGDLSFDGMTAEVKHPASISMITVIAEVFHVDDKAQAGDCGRNSGSGIHGANGPYPNRAGKGHGCAAQARQRIVQRPQSGNDPTALILARVFGNSPDFWLNVQRRTDIWEAMHSPRDRERIRRARPIGAAA